MILGQGTRVLKGYVDASDHFHRRRHAGHFFRRGEQILEKSFKSGIITLIGLTKPDGNQCKVLAVSTLLSGLSAGKYFPVYGQGSTIPAKERFFKNGDAELADEVRRVINKLNRLRNLDLTPERNMTDYSTAGMGLTGFRALLIRGLEMAMAQDPAEHLLATNTDPRFRRLPEGMSLEDAKRIIAPMALNFYGPLMDCMGLRALYAEIRDPAVEVLYPKEYVRVCAQLPGLRERIGRTNDLLGIIMEQFSQKDFAIKHDKIIKWENRPPKSVASCVLKLKNKPQKYPNLDAIRDHVAIMGVIGKEINTNLPEEQQENIEQENVAKIYITQGILLRIIRENLTKQGLKEGTNFIIHLDDYIAIPKSNNYKSFQIDVEIRHPTYVGFEIILRTPLMHQRAERGSSTHKVAYKGIDTEQQTTVLGCQDLFAAMNLGDAKYLEHLASARNADQVLFILSIVGKGEQEIRVPRSATLFDILSKAGINGFEMPGIFEGGHSVLRRTDDLPSRLILHLGVHNAIPPELAPVLLKSISTPEAGTFIEQEIKKQRT